MPRRWEAPHTPQVTGLLGREVRARIAAYAGACADPDVLGVAENTPRRTHGLRPPRAHADAAVLVAGLARRTAGAEPEAVEA